MKCETSHFGKGANKMMLKVLESIVCNSNLNSSKNTNFSKHFQNIFCPFENNNKLARYFLLIF
jgi:hypothetical protein